VVENLIGGEDAILHREFFTISSKASFVCVRASDQSFWPDYNSSELASGPAGASSKPRGG
jgi:hypothetical protein